MQASIFLTVVNISISHVSGQEIFYLNMSDFTPETVLKKNIYKMQKQMLTNRERSSLLSSALKHNEVLETSNK